MKIHPSRRGRGFTLVELLVVIAIIAVLAAAGFAAGNAAIQKARRTTALATATAMESAVNNFFIDYGSMPKDNLTGETVKVDTKNDLLILRELLGLGSTITLNTRAVKFLSVKEGKAKKNGLMYNTSGSDITGLYDPWGGPFFMALDGDYNEIVIPDPAAGGGQTLNGRRVAVWSNGADNTGLPGSAGTGQRADDVKTW